MDIRSIVTRNKIQMALLNCMKEKPFDDVLNKDIIAKAEISSRTFYHYYSDKNEILNEIESDILNGIKEANDKDYQQVTAVNQTLTDEANIELAEREFKNLVNYCSSIKEMVTILLSANGDIKFLSKIREISTIETKRRLDYLFKNNYLDIEKKAVIPASIIINIYSDVVVETIVTWLQSDTNLSPYQVRRILGQVQIKSPMELLLLLKRE